MVIGWKDDASAKTENDEQINGAFHSELVVDGRTVNPSQISNTNLVVPIFIHVDGTKCVIDYLLDV